MKKVWHKIVLLVMIVVVITGCGQENTEKIAAKNEKEKESTVTELTYWTFMALHTQHYEKMLKIWNEQNPDRQIRLNVREMEYNEMHNRLLLALQTGEDVPDMADVELGEFPRYVSLPEIPLASLDDAAAPYEEDILQSRLDVYRKDGTLYAFPTHVGTTVAFYNEDLLKNAGIDYRDIVTWKDFEKAGKRFYKKTGKYLGMADTFATWQASILCAQQGTDLVDQEGNPAVNSEEMVKGFEMLVRMQKENVLHTTAGGHCDNAETMAQIHAEEFACIMMPIWYMSRFVEHMPDLKGKMVIAPLPVLEEGMPRSVGLGGTGTVVPKEAPNRAFAEEFAAFAKLSEEANIEIWEGLGFDPCNTSVWKNEDVTHDPDNVYIQYFRNNPFDVLNELLEDDEIVSLKTTSAVPVIYDYLRDVVLGEIFVDGKPVREALDSAQAAIEEANAQ